MTQQIRFRAYDKRDGKIAKVIEIQFDTGNARLRYDDGKTAYLRIGAECELLQYTNRKDRNGHEIYRGHILRYVLPPEHGPDDNPDIYIVQWAEHGFEAEWANPATPRSSADGHLSMQDTEKDMEIIGTIFENPELLEKYKK